MERRRDLHIRRITEGRDKIAEFKQGSENAFSTSFKAWKDRINQSLGELFGNNHDYVKRFSRLSFWETRMSIGEFHWSPQDQRRFINDLYLAEQVLNDAIEEFEFTPIVPANIRNDGSSNVSPSIVVTSGPNSLIRCIPCVFGQTTFSTYIPGPTSTISLSAHESNPA